MTPLCCPDAAPTRSVALVQVPFVNTVGFSLTSRPAAQRQMLARHVVPCPSVHPSRRPRHASVFTRGCLRCMNMFGDGKSRPTSLRVDAGTMDLAARRSTSDRRRAGPLEACCFSPGIDALRSKRSVLTIPSQTCGQTAAGRVANKTKPNRADVAFRGSSDLPTRLFPGKEDLDRRSLPNGFYLVYPFNAVCAVLQLGREHRCLSISALGHSLPYPSNVMAT